MSLEITDKTEGTDKITSLKGRLDASTSSQLEAYLGTALDDVKNFTFDFSQLDYISSAGLRLMLSTQKKLLNKGNFKITGVQPEIKEVFDMTGFSDILTIE